MSCEARKNEAYEPLARRGLSVAITEWLSEAEPSGRE
jgi:hypothetical protein